MHRFYLPPDQCRDSSLCLTGREAHHAIHVLRHRVGQRAIILDGAGHELLCEITALPRDTVHLEVLERTFVPTLPCQITLLQALPKGKLIENIIEKATELGVARIVPLLTDRVTAQLDAADGMRKTGKWRAVAIEAIKQCGAAWLPVVDPPTTLVEFLARKERPDLALVGALQGNRRHPRECLREFEAKQWCRPRTVWIWIGPEGDFTPEESNAIQSAGAQPVSLGRLVLRTETAAIYCLSFLNYELHLGAGDA